MTSNLEDYLDQSGFDLDNFDLSDYTNGDYSSSDYSSGDYGSSDSSSGDYGSSDYSSGDYGSSDYGSSDTDWSDYFGGSSDSGSSDSTDYSGLSNDYGGDYSSGSSGDSSGSYGSYGSYGLSGGDDYVSDTCMTSWAFKSKGAKVDVAFDAIFFVLYLVLFGIAAVRWFKSKRKGAALGKWFLFIVSLFFGLLYLLLDIVALALNECQMLGASRYALIEAALRWFGDLSYFALVTLVLIPICLKLQGSGTFGTITLVLHTGWMAVTGIILIAAEAINTRVANAFYQNDVDKGVLDLAEHRRDIGLAFYALLFLAALLGAVNMVLSLFRRKNIRKGALLIGIPALILSSVGMTLVLLGSFADSTKTKDSRSLKYHENAQDAADFLSRLFYVLAFLSALLVAGSHQEIDEPTEQQNAPPVSQHVEYPPVAKPAEYPPPLAPQPAMYPPPASHSTGYPSPVSQPAYPPGTVPSPPPAHV